MILCPCWISPENLRDDVEIPEKSRVWNLGILGVELAEGKPPLFDVSPMRALFLIAKKDYQCPKLKNPERYSEEFNDFINSCLQKEVGERPTIEDLKKSNRFFVEKKGEVLKKKEREFERKFSELFKEAKVYMKEARKEEMKRGRKESRVYSSSDDSISESSYSSDDSDSEHTH